jgi:hypothetical protein
MSDGSIRRGLQTQEREGEVSERRGDRPSDDRQRSVDVHDCLALADGGCRCCLLFPAATRNASGPLLALRVT